MFDDFLNAVKDEEFEERPVELREFLYSDQFLNLPQLSETQEKFVEALTQVYRKDTLEELWGPEEAERLWNSTKREIILMLGKGSGKDLITSIAFARIAYLLLCLKDPAQYFNKPPGDSIAMLNVAINAKQAKNVFFRYFKQRVQLCPWFDGKYDPPTQDMIKFDKNIEAHSGHSEREAWEGYNFIIVCLDEISGFATEADSTGAGREKTADAIHKMYRASVSSRFPKFGKVALLSFPRYKGDYITKVYNEAVAEKVVKERSHTFKVHEDLPDGLTQNEFTIHWSEDEIVSYAEDGVYAVRKPTWEVNPIISIEDLKTDFLKDPEDSLGRFATEPPEAIDAFFKDRDRVERAFTRARPAPFRDDWSWNASMQPDKNKNYYIHVDLAYKHDRAVVAMASVDEWVTVNYGQSIKHTSPAVSIDCVRYWTPSTQENVNLEDVKNFIIELYRAGFPIKLVTFDRWNSASYRQQLTSDFHIKTDLLSVAKPHYEDFSLGLAENRVRGYHLPLLVDEFLSLRIIRGNKVDHTSRGSKDLADAVVGAFYNVVNNERVLDMPEVEIHVGAPSEERNETEPDPEPRRATKPMPTDLSEWLDGAAIL